MLPCPLCRKAKTTPKLCPYHRASDSEGLITALVQDLEKHGARGLVRLVLAGQSRLVELPPDLLERLAGDLEKIVADFSRVLEKPEFSVDDLQLLAALALVLAALHDPGDDPDDTAAQATAATTEAP